MYLTEVVMQEQLESNTKWKRKLTMKSPDSPFFTLGSGTLTLLAHLYQSSFAPPPPFHKYAVSSKCRKCLVF